MPFRVCKRFEIESGHLLSRHNGKCRFPHGHSLVIEVVLAADRLDAGGMVCDFATIKTLVSDFLDGWDHALLLNTDDPQFAFYQKTYGEHVVGFPHVDPTSEVLARVVFDELQRRLGKAPAPGVRVERVRVAETRSSWAEYAE